MKRLGIWALVLTLTSVACGTKKSHAPSVGEVGTVRARVAEARREQRVERVALMGTVEAEKTAAVSSRVMATVLAVHVKPGDRVRRGQVLVEIDPETARGQEAQARGALAQARAALALAERNFQRFRVLYESKAASELELDMARMQYEQAKGAVEQAEGAVAAAASVARESRVVAPFDGLVTAKLVEAGDLAAPGRPLVTLESAHGRRLVVVVPESLWAESPLTLGQELPVSLDAQPEHSMVGTVVEITPSADPATHSFTVKLALAGDGIAAGATGRAFLPGQRREVVLVPREAVLRVGGLTLVVVQDGQGLARSRVVTVGAEEAGMVEVLSGHVALVTGGSRGIGRGIA
ncbi:MAG: efflux RND transporter periplasmic adaptor subunit, partial [Thermoanaerobaculum sp.]|nr:efflux RND transporter periplasmic adaptor subunit [Thermoanaerobaculum sp.]